MALTVEDGTGVSGADTYNLTAAIDSYADDQGISRTLWDAATDAQQEAWARVGTRTLDSRWHRLFPGTATKLDQGLLWPRFDAIDREGYLRKSSTVPKEVTDAHAELTLLLANGTTIDADANTAADIEELEAASGARIKFAGAISAKQFRRVGYILEPILLPGGKWSKVPSTRHALARAV